MKKCFQLALAVGAVVAMCGTEAMASSYGSYGSYGGGSYADYGSSGSYGSHGGGLFSRIRERRAARQAARASYGSYGSSGSYGSQGGHSVSYGSAGTYGSSGAYGSAGAYGSSSESYGSAGTYGGNVVHTGSFELASNASSKTGDATILVSLPENAKVLVNGKSTSSQGTSRSYVSRKLRSGKTYSYDLQVEFQRNGETVLESKSIQIVAGQSVSVSFGQDVAGPQLVAAAVDTVETVLNIEVPKNATVFLTGAKTTQTGIARKFVTSRLATAQTWDNYTVRVELNQDGKQLVQERTLQVVGGETYELAFDFDQLAGVQVAQLLK